MSLAHNLCGGQVLAGAIDDCINNVLAEKNYAARIRGLKILYLLFTHSLRCGLEKYRQLRRLTSTFVNTSSFIGLYLCSNQ